MGKHREEEFCYHSLWDRGSFIWAAAQGLWELLQEGQIPQ